jgi:hypothetical protein
MVKEIKRDDETLYVCEVCGFKYGERRWAEECEEFCSKHHSCSLEIIRHAVQMNTVNSDK